MGNTVVVVDTNRVRPFADQPREYFDAGELISLELSIKQRGQLQPAMIRKITDDRDHGYELVDGQRRWHACTKLGIPLRAVIIDPENEEDQFEISVAANFQRAGHTPMEIAKAIERMRTQGGRTLAYIAALFGKTDPWIIAYQNLTKLVPEIQAQLEPSCKDPISVTLGSHLAKLPADQQMPILEEIKARGLSSSRAVDKIRRILLDGLPEPRNPRRGSKDQNLLLNNYVRRTIQDADRMFDKMGPDDFRRLVEFLVSKRTFDDVKENVMTAIGRLEVLHRRLTECRASISTSQPTPALRTHSAPKAQTDAYSHPMKCPKCGAVNTRFKRRVDADPARDYWVCTEKGCLLKISNYNIKIDRTYQPQASAASA